MEGQDVVGAILAAEKFDPCTFQKKGALWQILAQRIPITQVVVVQIHLGVGIMPLRLHLHRVNEIPS